MICASALSGALSKRTMRDLFITFCFIFIMTMNFYVNVWINHTQESETSAYPKAVKINQRRHAIHNQSLLTDSDKPKTVGQLPVPTLLTTTHSPPLLWPSLENFDEDRILAQLRFAPQIHKQKRWVIMSKPLKTIVLHHGFKDWDVKPGQQTFLDQKCAVNTCSLTDDRQQGSSAAAVLFKQYPSFVRYQRPRGQIWIYFMLEPPSLPIDLRQFRHQFNWTATFRRDSDIVAPYEKFVPHNETVKTKRQSRNYAAGKTKKVAWFVSNCQGWNMRMAYARELSKYIQVDVFGKCGPNKCSRGNNGCNEMLNTDYKFYLAFENSNCRDYITEKFFVTGLQHDIIPVVMGAPKEDYQRAAPYNSFIHVDDFASPRALAAYLHLLDQSDDLYNEYFRWKGTGTFINTFFWCRVCAMLHDESHGTKTYDDLDRWWRGGGVCVGRSGWKRHTLLPYITDYYSRWRASPAT